MTISLILALDSGTTSTRAMLFDTAGRRVAEAGRSLEARHPRPGWVEQDAAAIRDLSFEAATEVVARAPSGAIAAIGIANQRETAIAWDRVTGEPLAPAIVWQDRRTAPFCAALRGEGLEPEIALATGLLLDPYFSASKFRWMLDNVPAVAAAAAAGRLMLGTVDSWLLFGLTGGSVHATDVTNASRTLLMRLAGDRWDEDLCARFGIPPAALPAVRPSIGHHGHTGHFGAALPITGIAGDQQAASIGQACLAPGEAKCTYGTGIFLLAHAGAEIPGSANRLVATRAAAMPDAPAYALEGSVFVGGDAVKWLRDRLGLVAHSRETEALARAVPSSGGVQVVPAFAGLGAPWWEPAATGLITGITAATGRAELVRATLEAMGNQTADLLEAFARDGVSPTLLRVDGGMASNNWLCQDIADACGVPVERPRETETTALGAALLAAVGAGHFPDIAAAATAMVARDSRFEPVADAGARAARRKAWGRAVRMAIAGARAAGGDDADG
jgi:glycerol kinase